MPFPVDLQARVEALHGLHGGAWSAGNLAPGIVPDQSAIFWSAMS